MAPAPALTDGFGRTATDLRISITDKCDLRCTYCMPAEGMPWLRRPELLTDDEIVRLAGVAVGLGVREIRITGGEPLVRPGVVDLVRALAQLRPRPAISMTSNGMALADLAEPLAASGLDRVNISLDTLDPATFRAITRRPGHERVLNGLAAAVAAGLVPVKVNCVLIRGTNEHEAADLLTFCLDRGYELRFIESMPLDGGHTWDRRRMVSQEEIVTGLSRRYRLEPAPGRGAAPAQTWLVDGGPAKVGVIGSVTQPFCAACDRTRLTADGKIRNCLFAREETDLRDAMRAGASDETLADLWISAMAMKKAGHGVNDPTYIQPVRGMSAIGG
jgi:cyclic pyranopterin phosphate synthase